MVWKCRGQINFIPAGSTGARRSVPRATIDASITVAVIICGAASAVHGTTDMVTLATGNDLAQCRRGHARRVHPVEVDAGSGAHAAGQS